MSPNDKILWAFSAVFVVVATCLLVIPILRRKSDVFTTWNLFLLGSIIFTGLSGINATQRGHYLPSYRGSDYYLYYLGVVVFYASTLVGYHWWKLPRKIAGRRLLKWPHYSGWSLIVLTVALTSMGTFLLVQVPIPFIGQLLFQFGVAAPLLGYACSFIAWYRSPKNVLLFAFFLVVSAAMLVLVLSVGGSRRYLMSALAVVPLSLYWTWLRYKPTPTIVTWLLMALFVGLPVLMAFSAIRHSITDVRGTARAVEVIRQLPTKMLSGGSSEGFMGQDSVECAILAIHMLNDNSDRLEVSHFHSLIYILTNPVPRTLWEGKPVGFGTVLPEAARIDKLGITANLGVNVAGQCYYDGGLHIHILYGLLFAGFLRFYDELLVRQPGNPLLIGGLVFMTPQIIAFPRGGIETMGLQITLGLIVVVISGWLSRAVLGVGMVYPRTDHLVDYPVLRSPNDWEAWMRSYTAPAINVRTRTSDHYAEEDPS